MVLADKNIGLSLACKTRVQGCLHAVDHTVCHVHCSPAHQYNGGSAAVLTKSYQSVAN